MRLSVPAQFFGGITQVKKGRRSCTEHRDQPRWGCLQVGQIDGETTSKSTGGRVHVSLPTLIRCPAWALLGAGGAEPIEGY